MLRLMCLHHSGFQSEEPGEEQIHAEFIGVPYTHNFVPYPNKTVSSNVPQ